MADEIKPEEIIAEIEKWDLKTAGKGLFWSLASWKAAVPTGVAMSPAATAVIEKISHVTSGFGITLHIDKPVFDSMLPVVVFAGIIMAHNFVKYKTSDKPIAKFL